MIGRWLTAESSGEPNGKVTSSDRLWLIVAALAWLAAVATILPLGYGRDNDTFEMLRTWQQMVHEGVYVPSRKPGFPFAEFAIGFAASLGGAWLSNLLIAFFGAASAILAYRLALMLEVARPKLVAALFLANPWIMIQSSTSMDYMIAFACLLGGMVATLHGRLVSGVLLLAVSVGTRLPMLFYAGVFLWMAARSKRVPELRFAEAFAALFFISGLFYLPVWIASSLRFDWITASWIDDQGLAGRLARLIVKPTRLFGLLPSIAVAGLLALLCWRGRLSLPWRTSFAMRLSLAMCAVTVAIYARLPTDISYMIFMIPFLGVALVEAGAVPVLRLLIAGGLITAVVDIDPVKVAFRDDDYCRGLALPARVSPHFIKGPVLAEITDREYVEPCFKPILRIPYVESNKPLP